MVADILLSLWLGILAGSLINAALGWIDSRHGHTGETLQEARAFRLQLSGAVTLGAVTVSLLVVL